MATTGTEAKLPQYTTTEISERERERRREPPARKKDKRDANDRCAVVVVVLCIWDDVLVTEHLCALSREL